MPILRIPDGNGDYVSVPSIKGDQGPRGLQGPEGPPGPRGADGTIPTSDLAAINDIKSRMDALKTERVSVKDYGAKGDGVTDDYAAITAAIGSGKREVIIPAGTYLLTQGLRLPSNTALVGAGMGITELRFANTAALSDWLVTNRDRTTTGNQFITIRDMTLNGRVKERCPTETTTILSGQGGGSRGSNLTLGNVQYAWVQRVASINPILHSFDIASADINYPYTGDAAYSNAKGPSEHILIDSCYATNWGDDGFTTHHSQYLFLTNNYAEFPRLKGNNNGFEIDDGSRHVYLSNNSSQACYGGIEIKAHATAPASRDVHINGHLSIKDVRSFNWRHIGHHSDTDPDSKSAFDIVANNLTSLYPQNTTGFQDEATPRGLCISAYHRVSVTGMTIIGDPNVSYDDQAAIAVQFKSGDVTLTDINIYDMGNTSQDIYISGNTKNTVLKGINCQNSGQRGIYIGNGTSNSVSIYGCTFVAPKTATTHGIDAGYVTDPDMLYIDAGTRVTGYSTSAVRVHGANFPSVRYAIDAGWPLPSGVTRIRDLPIGVKFYLTTAQFSSMTDRPSSASGAYLLYTESSGADASGYFQTLTRWTSGTAGPTTYKRALNSDGSAIGPWFLIGMTNAN